MECTVYEAGCELGRLLDTLIACIARIARTLVWRGALSAQEHALVEQAWLDLDPEGEETSRRPTRAAPLTESHARPTRFPSWHATRTDPRRMPTGTSARGGASRVCPPPTRGRGALLRGGGAR